MNFVPQDPHWEDKVRDSLRRQTFLELLGAEIETLTPGHCSLLIRRRPDLCQQHGFIHGGVTAALADTSAGYAAFSLMPPDSTVLTTEFKINLLAPAMGDSFVARASVIKPGRTLTAVYCTVFALSNAGETPIASFLGTMMCLHGRSDQQ